METLVQRGAGNRLKTTDSAERRKVAGLEPQRSGLGRCCLACWSVQSNLFSITPALPAALPGRTPARPLPPPAPCASAPPPPPPPCMTSKAPGWPPSPFLRLEAERSSGHAGALPGTALGVRPKPLKRPPGPPTSAASALAASPRPLPARQAQCLPFPEGARSSASPGPVPGSP